MSWIVKLYLYAVFEKAREIVVHFPNFIKLFSNTNGQVLAEVLILACTFIYTHFSHMKTVKALFTLSASTAASKHLCLIDNAISTKFLMSWPFFNNAAMFYIETLYLYAILEQALVREILVHIAYT